MIPGLFVEVFDLVTFQFMVGLDAQGSDQAIQNVIIVKPTRTELFPIAIEKLAIK